MPPRPGYNPIVPRAALFGLLVLALLSGVVEAQRVVGSSHGGFGRPHPVRGFASGGFHHRSIGYGSYFLPYDGFGYEQGEYEAPPREPAQVVVPRAPEPPVPKGQVIEIAVPANAGPVKEVPPAIFILSNGERIESRRFLLTADSLSIRVDRQERTMSLGQVDLHATIAANHERGIELRIPDDRNEISLSF